MSWGKDQRVNNGRYQILDRIGTGGFGVTYRIRPTGRATVDRVIYGQYG
jgi:hypothetical protein